MAANDHSIIRTAVPEGDGYDYTSYMEYCKNPANWFKRARGEFDDKLEGYVTEEQWLEDCDILMTAWMYGNPPGGWSDPERCQRFKDRLNDLERRMCQYITKRNNNEG